MKFSQSSVDIPLCVLPGPWAVIQLPPTHEELAMPRSQGSSLLKCR
jgi:hypothetical protein